MVRETAVGKALNMAEERILFTTEEGENVPFYVIEQTTIAGSNYLLVTDSEEGEEGASAYIMKEMKDEQDQLTYELMEDEQELAVISRVFEELLEDIEIEL